MISEAQQLFLEDVYQGAMSAGAIWPQMQACEAALESAWGTSSLSVQARNLFGQKASPEWPGQTVSIPTREYLHGKWVFVPAEWCSFPNWESCFDARMRLLQANPCYAEALAASGPESFIELVSRHWSTDPNRAGKVLAIYDAHGEMLTA